MSRPFRPQAVDLGVAAAALVLSVLAARARDTGLLLAPQAVHSLPYPIDRVDTLLPAPFSAPGEGGALVLAACVLLLWRRRYPVPVALAAIAASLASPAIVPALVAVFTVAVRCRTRTALWVEAAGVAPGPLHLFVDPFPSRGFLGAVLVGVVLVAGTTGWGFVERARRERVERAEAEAVLRVERAQQRAREEVAREMHDVLAHRLSLLSVHAGALEINRSASPEEVGRAAAVVRESAHQALEDLQAVLRVLRTPRGGAEPSADGGGHAAGGAEPPQPTLEDLDALLAESRAAGMRIETAVAPSVGYGSGLPAVLGRTAYRVVQESLTNARKHAPGEPVRIALDGGAEQGLTVRVANPLPRGGGRARVPGAGQGLIGLTERVALAGGRLHHGRTGEGFEVRAWLPWSA